MGGRADDFGRDGGGRGDESPKRAIEWPKWRDIARMIIAPISSPSLPPLAGSREEALIRSNLRHKDEEPRVRALGGPPLRCPLLYRTGP